MSNSERKQPRKASAAARVSRGPQAARKTSGTTLSTPRKTIKSSTPRVAAPDAKPAVRDSAKPVAGPAIDDQLSTYFRHLGEHDLLTADDERRLSLAIETAEFATWELLLNHVDIVAHVLDFIEPNVKTVTNASDAAPVDAPLAALPKLRRLAAQVSADKALRTDARHAKKLAVTAREAAVQLRGVDLDREHIDAVVRDVERLHTAARLGEVTFWSKANANKAVTTLQAVRQAYRTASQLRGDFVRANLRLVVTMARRYDRGQMQLADLIQEGNLGLMHSVGRFDHRRGLRFSTYACWWIRHAIGRALADKARAVRIPVHMLEAQQQLEKVRRELTRELGRPPAPHELAKAARVPISKLDQMHQYVMGQAISLDKPVHGDDERTLGDTMADPDSEHHSPEDNMTSDALNVQVKGMLQFLTPIEADVLTKRFGIGDDEERTFREIGDEYALSRERIRQIQNSALDKLKRALEREHRGHVER
ncbi:MAG: sigma-70 family RNA polymerase sigma factor [Kofleriaceae bacterium]|nr:sigma-70 family RNA polymerase sigma factor [Kofleriaceae bacterium]